MARKFKCNNEQVEVMRMLRNMEGLSYERIGKVFGVSGETAKSYILPEYRKAKDARKRARLANMKATAVDDTQKENALRQVTLAEVAKKAAREKKIHGEIRNATIDDLATLNDVFENVSFTIYFD